MVLFLQDKTRLDITRLQRVSAGFGNFTTSGIRSSQASPDQTNLLDDNSREVLKLVFSRDGSFLQVKRNFGLTLGVQTVMLDLEYLLAWSELRALGVVHLWSNTNIAMLLKQTCYKCCSLQSRHKCCLYLIYTHTQIYMYIHT